MSPVAQTQSFAAFVTVGVDLGADIATRDTGQRVRDLIHTRLRTLDLGGRGVAAGFCFIDAPPGRFEGAGDAGRPYHDHDHQDRDEADVAVLDCLFQSLVEQQEGR